MLVLEGKARDAKRSLSVPRHPRTDRLVLVRSLRLSIATSRRGEARLPGQEAHPDRQQVLRDLCGVGVGMRHVAF